jgi:hypothetical protein
MWVIQWWVTALFGAIVGALSMAIKSLRARQKEQQGRQGAVEKGLQALLHSELYKECEECEKKGFATIDDLESIEYLYNPYHALGGNGTGTTLYDRVKQLPGNPAERG